MVCNVCGGNVVFNVFKVRRECVYCGVVFWLGFRFWFWYKNVDVGIIRSYRYV